MRPLYKPVCAALLCLILAACGPSAPPPDVTGTPRRVAPVVTYREPTQPLNRLNADQIVEIGRLVPASAAPRSVISAVFVPNSTRLATLDGQQLILWDLVTGRPIFDVAEPGGQAVFYSVDKTELFLLRQDGVVAIYGEEGGLKTTLRGHEAYNGRYAYHAASGILALGA